jgi:hypothetical protein
MPPLLLFDDDIAIDPVVKLWENGWFARLLTEKRNFGNPLELPEPPPPPPYPIPPSSPIPSFVFLPPFGLILALPSHLLLLLHSPSDGLTSIFAGTGHSFGSNEFRTRSPFSAPSGLCISPDGLLFVVNKDNGTLPFINPAGQVSLFTAPGKSTPMRTNPAVSITNALQGGFLLLERGYSYIKHVFLDGRDRSIFVQPYNNQSIPLTATMLLPLKNGRNLILSTLGLFSILDNGYYNIIVTAEYLGFAPAHAIELTSHLFLISDDKTTYVASIGHNASEALVIKPFSEVIGVEENDKSFLASISGPFCFDEASSTIWAIKSLEKDILLVTFRLEDVLNGLATPLPSASPSAPASSSSSNASSSSFQVSFQTVKHFIGHKNRSLKFAVAHLTTLEPAPPSSLAVTPTGHLLEYRSNDIRWFEEDKHVFESFAGDALDFGLCDAFRLQARFNGIGSVCFIPIAPVRLDQEADSRDLKTKKVNSNTKHSKELLRTREKSDIQMKLSFKPKSEGGKSEISFLASILGTTHQTIVADTENHRLREILLDGEVRTYAGTEEGRKDGPKSEATFSRPKLMTVGRYGELFVTSASDFSIRRISRDGMVTTLKSEFKEYIISHSVNAFNFTENPLFPSSYTSICADIPTGALLLSYENIMFVAQAQQEYKEFCWNEIKKERCQISDSKEASSAASLPSEEFDEKLDFPQNPFKLSRYIGAPLVSDHKDGDISKAAFTGQVSMAMLQENSIEESSISLTKSKTPQRPHFLILDGGNSSVRQVLENQVTTVAGGLGVKESSKEGSAGFSHFSSLQSISSFDHRSVIVNDKYGQLFMISDIKKMPTWAGLPGFLRFIPSEVLSDYKKNLSEFNGLRPMIDEVIGLKGNQSFVGGQYSDFELKWFGTVLQLHHGILEHRAPGLLKEDVVKEIEKREWMSKEEIGGVLMAIYCDQVFQPLPLLNPSSGMQVANHFNFLANRYGAVRLMECEKLIEGVERQIQDLFRFVGQMSREWVYSESYGDNEGDEEEDVGGTAEEIPHCAFKILAKISDFFSTFPKVPFSSVDGESLTTSLFELFLPYAVSIYPRLDVTMTQKELLELFPNAPHLPQRLLQQIFSNRCTLPAINLNNCHQQWETQWSSLIVPIQKGTVNPPMVSSEPVPLIRKTSLISDLTILGESKQWNVHKWIMAAKSPFFECLFASDFADAKQPSWQAPRSQSEPGYMCDEALDAFIEYIYTENPNPLLSLPNPSHLSQIINALPFYFVQFANHHLSLIPDIV